MYSVYDSNIVFLGNSQLILPFQQCEYIISPGKVPHLGFRLLLRKLQVLLVSKFLKNISC